jgi:hypothetical protein
MRGQSLVELALVIPVMLSLFVGVYAAAGYIADRQVAGQAARAGARLGAEIGSNAGTTYPCQGGVSDNPCGIDQQIIQQTTTIGKGLIDNGTIDEIDIYLPCQGSCATQSQQQCATAGASGDYPAGGALHQSIYKPDTSNPPVFVLQSPPGSFGMSYRVQQHPIESAISVRVVYTFRASVPLFTYFDRTSSEYATMCFSPKFS